MIFYLILELQSLEMELQSIFHVFHVSGNRIRSQGADGFSRGDIPQGVGIGEAFESFVPLVKTAL